MPAISALVVAQETLDPDLTSNGVMNEGLIATHLGLAGIPREAEIIALERDLRIAALTGCDYHAAKLSTADFLRRNRRATRRAAHKVTAAASINHLSLNENDIGALSHLLQAVAAAAQRGRPAEPDRRAGGRHHRHHRLGARSAGRRHQAAALRGGRGRRDRAGDAVRGIAAALSQRPSSACRGWSNACRSGRRKSSACRAAICGPVRRRTSRSSTSTCRM